MQRIYMPSSGIEAGVSNLDTRNISKADLTKLVEIEQDMWAREESVGEYVKCKGCGKIHSKEDVFGHIERKVKVLTVAEIERLLGGGNPNCISCSGETESIYDRNEYIDVVRERYRNSVASFLTVYRDNDLVIRGFLDGYLDDFNNIYRREFEHNYRDFGRNGIKQIIKTNLGVDLPELLFLCSALGMEEGHKNFNIVFEIMRTFFLNIIEADIGDTMGIYEVPIGTNAHSIYHITGGEIVGISNDKEMSAKVRTKEGQTNDIFIHRDMAHKVVRSMSTNPKDFLKANLRTMKEVLKVA